jgi:hypothetical protein
MAQCRTVGRLRLAQFLRIEFRVGILFFNLILGERYVDVGK